MDAHSGLGAPQSAHFSFPEKKIKKSFCEIDVRKLPSIFPYLMIFQSFAAFISNALHVEK